MSELNEDELGRRSRALTHKGFNYELVNRTKVFNSETKKLQRAIDELYAALNQNENFRIPEALAAVKLIRDGFQNVVNNLDDFWVLDRWDESTEVKATVSSTAERFFQATDEAIKKANERLSDAEEATKYAAMSNEFKSHAPTEASVKSKPRSRLSLNSERRRALAEVAAAKERTEYDILIARRINERKQLEAEEKHRKGAEKARYEHDLAILKAQKLEAIAKAKLDAIEQSILDDDMSSQKSAYFVKSHTDSDIKEERTAAWLGDLPRDLIQTTQTITHQSLSSPLVTPLPHSTSSFPETVPRRPSSTVSQPSQLKDMSQCMCLTSATNQRLASTLAKLSLPKCHPDVFSGDPTMFHPWKTAFKGMLENCAVGPSNEINYLNMYTSGAPQKLVDSYRRRQHNYPETLLKKLWTDLEDRFGNPATITNAFLLKLRETSKFGDDDKIKLQTFADLCADVAAQMDLLPGLAYLNYPNGLRSIFNNLPESICSKWYKYVVERSSPRNPGYPKFSEFAVFIQKQSNLRNHPSIIADPRRERKKIPHSKVFAGLMEEAKGVRYCYYHKTNSHNLVGCKAFSNLTLDQKNEFIKKTKLCFRCFSPGHIAIKCKVNIECGKCHSKRHPTLLHKRIENDEGQKDMGEKGYGEEQHKEEEKLNDGEEVVTTQTKVGQAEDLPVSCSKIILLDIFHPSRPTTTVRTYALIDEQSNACMISPTLVDQLGLQSPKERYLLSTCSATKEIKFGRRVSGLQVKSLNGIIEELPTLIECDNIPKDKREIPTPKLAKQYNHLKDIAKEIPPIDTNADIQLLIGRNAPEIMKVRAFRNGPPGSPWAHKLSIGWAICGQQCVDRNGGPIHVLTHRTVYHATQTPVGNFLTAGESTPKGNTGFQNALKSSSLTAMQHQFAPCPNNFFIKDSFPEPWNMTHVFQRTERDNEPSLSIEDRRFLNIMESGARKNEAGNWELPLPLKSNDVNFPNNKEFVLNRFKSLTRSFEKKPQMEADYFRFMANLIQCGHAEPAEPNPPLGNVTRASTRRNTWYLPHFGVYNPRKPKKIRVVFDASAVFQGKSLNRELLSGPDSLNNLLGILLRFRSKKIGVICDIEQMFHAFYVYPPHRDLMRFVWYRDNDKENEVIDYKMSVHVFGNTSSPAVATFGLRKTADEGKDQFGDAANKFVHEDFYVDDGITSCDTADETLSLIANTRNMLRTANLRLHRIASNSPAVMKSLPQQDKVENLRNLDPSRDPLPQQRSLGVVWNLEKDAFTFQVALPEKPFTRRGVLAVVNSIFDPFGFVIPTTLQGRLLLRKLIQIGNKKEGNKTLGWDDPLPDAFLKKWLKWKNSLEELDKLSIPRCYHWSGSGVISRLEIHAFSDASEQAIATVIYMKSISTEQDICISLLYAQAKLAPKQATTIPRLELCAAVLSVNAVQWITRELKLNITATLFYTDSKVVLGYIRSESKRFYVYVANRVNIIRSSSKPNQWRFVQSSDNPADIATRGKTPSDLKGTFWFRGPDFIKFDLPPQDLTEVDIKEGDPEIREEITTYATKIESKTKGLGSQRFQRFSKWSTLRTALATLIKKAERIKSQDITQDNTPHTKPREHLSLSDLKKAETLMIKTVQREAYAQEIHSLETLKTQDQTPSVRMRRSSLYRLQPFLDDRRMLRVGGRLRRAKMEYEEKHPVILPKSSHLTTLIIRHYHEQVHHQGKQITHGRLRNAGIWIVGASRRISSCINQCVKCKKLRGRPLTQIMADLPKDRLDTPPAPFTNVGFDVFGPWTIQTRKLRGGALNSKRWGLVFTCLNCRAIHIEIIESMDTNSFLCALRRFFAIRGPATLLRCDRGTNFIGGQSELDEAMKSLDQRIINNYVTNQNCEWQFNPPRASHFGGVWERQIGTIRRVLDGMFLSLGSHQLTHELLVTLMAEVTGIVNSRPIATISVDPEQPQPLTPNALLTMKTRPLISPPGVFSQEDLYSRRYWRRAQYLADQFWSRWKHEYLQSLQVRPKWNKVNSNLQVGDIVIINDDSPRNQWPLGKIVKAMKSKDGLVRKVELVTTIGGVKKCYERPIKDLVFIMHSST